MLAFSLRAVPLNNGRGGVFVFEQTPKTPTPSPLINGIALIG